MSGFFSELPEEELVRVKKELIAAQQQAEADKRRIAELEKERDRAIKNSAQLMMPGMIDRGTINSQDMVKASHEWQQRAETAEAELATVTAERNALRDLISRACNALTDSIRVSGNDADTNMYWVRKLKNKALSFELDIPEEKVELSSIPCELAEQFYCLENENQRLSDRAEKAESELDTARAENARLRAHLQEHEQLDTD